MKKVQKHPQKAGYERTMAYGIKYSVMDIGRNTTGVTVNRTHRYLSVPDNIKAKRSWKYPLFPPMISWCMREHVDIQYGLIAGF